MPSINYRELMLRLVREHDPVIDLGDGAPFTTDVIEPLMAALSHDPYATNISKYMRTLLQQQVGLEIKDGSFLEDILDKGPQVLLEPLRREINRLGVVQSLRNVRLMTDDDVDNFAANRFIIRDPGEFAQVRIRIYFSSPSDEEVFPDNIARSRNGLVFLPARNQRITKTQMATQTEGSFYYWDVIYVAAEPGSQYNVERGQITTIDGLLYARVSNLSKATFGEVRDTNTDMVIRMGYANSQASMVSDLGIAHVLSKNFEGRLRLILSIGRNDPEMLRDTLTAAGTYRAEVKTWVTFPLVVSGSDGEVDFVTDIAGFVFTIPAATYNNAYDLAAAINTAWISAGGNSYIVTPWKDGAEVGVVWHSDSTVLGENSTILFQAEPNDAYSHFKLDSGGSTLLSTLVGQTLTGSYSGTLSLDGIPGGIIEPDTPEGLITVPANTLHIGAGAEDIYTAPRSVEERTWTVPVLEHKEPTRIFTSLNTTISSSVVEITSLFEWGSVQVGDVIAIYGGSDAGLYPVLEQYDSGGSYYLRLGTPSGGMTATAINQVWANVAPQQVSVDMHEPYRVILRNTGMQGTLGSATVSDPATVLTGFGVALGHQLVIESGDNAGLYNIIAILGSNTLVLDRPMVGTDAAMDYKVILPYDPILLPVREFVTVEEVDTTGRPTGATIPYRWPVDIRVIDAFSNLGTGKKIEGGTLSTTANSNIVTSAEFGTLGVSVGDRIVIASGDNQGFYRVEELQTTTQVRINAYMNTTGTSTFDSGSPSVGTVRLYFLDPTSFEGYAQYLNTSASQFRLPTLFKYQPEVGGPTYQFEPTFLNFTYQRVPEPSSTTYPSDLNKVSANQVQSLNRDFNALGVVPGDLLSITTGAHPGSYVITAVNFDTLTVDGSPFSGAISGDSFFVWTPQTQGIMSTSMSENQEGPFYYMDIELNSLGTGDEYNVEEAIQLELDRTSNFYSEGWDITVENSNLSYSTKEKPTINYTNFYLETGLPELRTNRSQIYGSGARVTYNRPDLIADIQSFMTSSRHRVICADPLARHLLPVLTYLGFSYQGGSTETVVRLSLKRLIENLIPEEDLNWYMITSDLRKRGVEDVTGALELVGIHWREDRTVTVARSTDRLSTGRTSCFIVLNGELSDVRRV